ncbi:MAG: helix-hairpin-helix domain-containing protein [candidate division KSB1 bacterium]|nr:helix-hairpin-helix domain-containing protein [candidate division KSB1 bacterium]MDZ7367890.1 helix-hairpin-helix domain-containing protein [candidate division KSB1 bacterium]MDZ7407517.1 helix-hairpin-helix domain-containing protein [candidate division KSB1 bacterium]
MARYPSKSFIALLAVLLCLPSFAIAQETLIEQLSEQEAENNAENENHLQELLSHPLEINQLNREDLLRLPFLWPAQINAFLQQREKVGAFKNLDEALAALEVTGDTLALCREIFFLSSPRLIEVKNFSVRWRMTRPATVEERWLGPPYRSYERAMISTGALALGVLAERDPGEQRLDDHRLFYGLWQAGSQKNMRRVIAGNYQIEWAQGLLLWSPYGMTLSAEVHAASRREGRGLLPYLSGDENAALRGGALAWTWPRLALLAFASSQRLNARLIESAVVSYDESGYHRTATELSHRRTLQEKIVGAAIKMNWPDKVALGVLAYRSEYDKEWIRRNLSTSYFDFSGRVNELIGFSLSSTAAGLQANVELAKSRSGGVAGSAVLSGEASRLRWTVESHYYDRNFHSPRGRGFNSIADPPQNEFGYSLGLSRHLRRGLWAEIFVAKRQDLWRTTSLPLPGAQLRAGARLDWKIQRGLLLQMRWQQTRRDELMSATSKIISPQSRHSGRLKIDYQASAALRLTLRLDIAEKSPLAAKHGLALSQEAQWKMHRRWQITTRYTLFDTPAQAPIYLYEHDLPGIFTNFALRERGRRAYIYLRYLSTFGLDFSLKLAGTELDRSIFEHRRSGAWGAQIDWRLRP